MSSTTVPASTDAIRVTLTTAEARLVAHELRFQLGGVFGDGIDTPDRDDLAKIDEARAKYEPALDSIAWGDAPDGTELVAPIDACTSVAENLFEAGGERVARPELYGAGARDEGLLMLDLARKLWAAIVDPDEVD
jgi:hypothetical protein